MDSFSTNNIQKINYKVGQKIIKRFINLHLPLLVSSTALLHLHLSSPFSPLKLVCSSQFLISVSSQLIFASSSFTVESVSLQFRLTLYLPDLILNSPEDLLILSLFQAVFIEVDLSCGSTSAFESFSVVMDSVEPFEASYFEHFAPYVVASSCRLFAEFGIHSILVPQFLS